MSRRLLAAAVFAIAALASAPTVLAQTPPGPFDPREYHARTAGQRTQVLVLGSPHLSGAPETFDPSVLEPLLARLQAFAPDVIAIESLSGENIQHLTAYSAVYLDTAKDYGGRMTRLAAMGQAGTGLDMPAAEAAARAALGALPEHPTAAQRRRLAALFAAAGDPHSALVQWWRLAPAERIAADGVNEDLAKAFAQYDQRRNESHQIGSRLAARLGLERVYAMDDQSAVDLIYARLPEFEAYFGGPEVASRGDVPGFRDLAQASARLTTPDQALETFRQLNTAATGRLDAEVQWGFLVDAGPDIKRVRLAEWETRNLRMAANIREAAAAAPGGRVLVIVGSSHKPWLDAYLAMMSDVEIVDAAAVLR